MSKAETLSEAQELLLQSMFMLEMYGDGRYLDADLAFAGHSMVQRAQALLCGRTDDLPPVTKRGQEICAEQLAAVAIEDAKEASKHGKA